ncbi:MAG: response regulator [bacterium]
MTSKILIVDDEKELNEVLCARVEYAGYSVESVNNGREAIGAYIESLHKEPFSLILLDIMMPGLNGLEVLKIIREEEELRGIGNGDGVPVIMLTALKDAWMKSINEGSDDYLIKPYESENLLKKIREKLGKKDHKF